MRRKIEDLGVISSKMIQIIMKCNEKNFFLTFLSPAAAEYKNRDYYFKWRRKLLVRRFSVIKYESGMNWNIINRKEKAPEYWCSGYYYE